MSDITHQSDYSYAPAMQQFYTFLSSQFEIAPQSVGQNPKKHVRTLMA